MIKKIIFFFIFILADIGYASFPLESAPHLHNRRLAILINPIVENKNKEKLTNNNIPDQHLIGRFASKQTKTQPPKPILSKSESESSNFNSIASNKAVIPGQLEYIQNDSEQRKIRYQTENSNVSFAHTLSIHEKEIADEITKAQFQDKLKNMLDQYSQLLAEPTENILKKAGAAKVSTIEFIRLMFIRRYTKKNKRTY